MGKRLNYLLAGLIIGMMLVGGLGQSSQPPTIAVGNGTTVAGYPWLLNFPTTPVMNADGSASIFPASILIDEGGNIIATSFSSPKVSGQPGQVARYGANSTDTYTVGELGPATTIAETWWYQDSAAQPTAGQFKLYGAPAGSSGPGSTKISAQTWGTFGPSLNVTAGVVNAGVNNLGTFAAPITDNPYALTAANSYGSVLYYGATGVVNAPTGAVGMNVMVKLTGSYTVTWNPQDDGYVRRYDGTLQAVGVSATFAGTAGMFIVFECDAAGVWQVLSYDKGGTLAQGS